ncbi:hypothetical protein GCM10023185_38430 [Hymenobacter saemangeumensis]|uniref:Outer membrane protein beta-barrel domain-containing protein n=1 Tax=Hymenobacter saemangeumensis TaxID=1084522 RepID=A0ABP8IQH2_9BACT
MLDFRSFFASLGLASLAFAAHAQSTAPETAAPGTTAPKPAATAAAAVRRYPAVALGLTLGYGAPYGWGVDLSSMVTPRLDVGGGFGFSITGGKIGLGARYYFSPEHKVSPFAGANLVYSSGLKHVTVTNSSRSGTYSNGVYTNTSGVTVVNFRSSSQLHLRGGARWQPTNRFAMIGALGYGIVLGGDPVEYVSGDTSPSARNLVSIFSPGGLELSVGVSFGLSPRY